MSESPDPAGTPARVVIDNRDRVNPLDAMVVGGALAIIAFVVGCLVFVTIPQSNLAIIAGLAGTLLGTVIGGYAGFRWGASVAAKQASSPDPKA